MRAVSVVVAGAILIGVGAPALADEVEVPINVGVGSAAFWLGGPAAVDQSLYYGVKLDMAAIIDRNTIARYQDRIPAQYRAAARSMGEAKVGLLYIPDSLMISPGPLESLYGATWRPVSLGIPLLNVPRLSIDLGVVGTVAYMFGRDIPTTLFVRPGADVGASLELPLSPSFHVKLGYDEQVYIPQRLGVDIGDFGTPSTWLWNWGEPYLELDFRFPYKASF